MKKLLLLSQIVFVCYAVQAQVQHSGWLATFHTIKLDKKFSLHFDAQLRSTDKIEHIQSLLLRPGVNMRVTKFLTASLGYGYILNRRTVGTVVDYLPEHRIWQQAILQHKIKNIGVAHRFRFEERWLSQAAVQGNDLKVDGYKQAFRLRYFVRGLIPFTAGQNFTKGPYLALQNEIFLNTGNKKAVNGKTFDQNRAYAAIGYRLHEKLDVETGYMNQYIDRAASFTNNHVVQVALYTRL